MNIIPKTLKLESIKPHVLNAFDKQMDALEDAKIALEADLQLAKDIERDIELAKEKQAHSGFYKCSLTQKIIENPKDQLLFRCGHLFSAAAVLEHLKKHLLDHPETMLHGAYRIETERNEKLRAIFEGSQHEIDVDRRETMMKLGMATILPHEWMTIVRCECVLCGSVTVQSSLDPFLTRSELEDAQSWDVSAEIFAPKPPPTSRPLPKTPAAAKPKRWR